MSLSHAIDIAVAWIPGDRLEISNSNVNANKVNYWWQTLGKWQYESRNSSSWRYKFTKSRDKNKNHTLCLVFCSNRTPQKSPRLTSFVLRTQGFCLVISSWILVKQNTSFDGFNYCHSYDCIYLQQSPTELWRLNIITDNVNVTCPDDITDLYSV